MVDTKQLRVLIVDDEPFARERVRRLLASEADVEVVGECGDGFCAVDAVKQLLPNLLFLDVQMPGRDGFGVLAELTPEDTPLVIFLTAYDKYAVRAFEAAALDYLLKPFDEERFRKAVARARIHFAQLSQLTDQRFELTTGEVNQTASVELNRAQKFLERVVIRAGGRVFFRRTDEIDWIESYGNYVRLHFDKSAYLLRETISNLETRLDPEKFVRVHRSALVQITRVRELQLGSNGSYQLVLQNGAQLPVSRRYRRRLLDVLPFR